MVESNGSEDDVAFTTTSPRPRTLPAQCPNSETRGANLQAEQPAGGDDEATATLAALVRVSGVAILSPMSGGNISAVGWVLAIGPFIAALYARPWRVALVGLLAAFFALVIGTPPHNYGQLNHVLRVVTQVVATAVAMYIAYLRGQRNVQLSTAHTETRNERRRRVAAETAQRMQAMARAQPDHGPLPGGGRRLRRPA